MDQPVHVYVGMFTSEVAKSAVNLYNSNTFDLKATMSDYLHNAWYMAGWAKDLPVDSVSHAYRQRPREFGLGQ